LPARLEMAFSRLIEAQLFKFIFLLQTVTRHSWDTSYKFTYLLILPAN